MVRFLTTMIKVTLQVTFFPITIGLWAKKKKFKTLQQISTVSSIVWIGVLAYVVSGNNYILDERFQNIKIPQIQEGKAFISNVLQSLELPSQSNENIFEGYTKIEVDGGDLSGHRKPNVVVDIGFGDREYWAFTNEYGQLIKVVADKIVLQDEDNEPVLSTGRYYRDEAKVPGVESKTLDEGHVIADSLGGVSNAYNITPQNSTLNRHGDQAYMEKVIRDAGGCTNFVAEITYPNTTTQIPSHYSMIYTVKGNRIHDEFDNKNPEK